jgi:hypothetical protein
LRKALAGRSKRVLDKDGVVLYLDREPLRWGGDATSGVAWAEALPVAPARPRTWQEAAAEWGVAGVVFDGRRYWLRTRRSISAGPLELIGSHVPVTIPFACDLVVRAGLAVEPRQKLEGGLYRHLWEAVDPRLAALPSTNDPGYDPRPRNARRIVMSRRAVRGYVEILSTHPLRPLFSRTLDRAIERGRIRPYLRDRQRLQTLDALCRFALWHERYQDRLRPLDFEGLGTPRAVRAGA